MTEQNSPTNDSSDAMEYAAKVAGLKSFHAYAESRHVLGGHVKGMLPSYLTAHAKYKIVEHLQQVGRADQRYLEGLSLHGANPNGPTALSELRNLNTVVRNIRARAGQYQLAPGVTLSSFAGQVLDRSTLDR